MKATINQLINSLGTPAAGDPGAFNRFIAQALPIKSAMRLKAIARSVDQHLADYNETRIETLKRLGKLNQETGNYEFDTSEIRAEFNREYHSLLDAEVELPGERFQASTLLFSLTISPADLMALEWLIDDGTPAEIVEPINDELAKAVDKANNAKPGDILELGDELAASASA